MIPDTSIYEYAKHSLIVSSDQPAIWFHDKCMTYRELFWRIDNVADHLAQLGVKEGTVVSIHLPNCPQAVMAIYAVAKLGGVCNMVHPQMPEEALKQYVSFTGSEYLISYDRPILEHSVANTCIYVDVISYMTGYAQIEALPSNIWSFMAMTNSCPVRTAGPEQKTLAAKCAAYMHSTGTTGSPKTVMLSHKAVNSWVDNLKGHYCGDPLHEQVCLCVSPLHHAMGLINELHRAVSYGAQLVLLDRWNCDTAISMIKAHRVSYITGVPSMYRDLLRNPDFSGSGISSITYCIVAGEPVPTELIEQLDQRVGNGKITLCAYGLTEICGAVCAHSHERRKETASGYPLDNTRIMVLDSSGHMSSTGRGQLIVTSDSVMLGYLKEPQATEEACIRYDDSVWLKTGDFGEVDEEGYVSCLSRMKDIIIRKGNNIFPGEVEQIIRGVAEVAEVCVIGLTDEKNATESVCAVVILLPGTDEAIARSKILEECRKFLPHYAIPEKLIFNLQIPHNKMGKRDRKALKELL